MSKSALYMKNVLLLFIFLLGYPASDAFPSKAKVDSILSVLDSEIENQEYYYQKKEYKIDGLREQFFHFRNPRIRFDFCDRLYNEYISYKFDSAYIYARRSIELAREMNDNEACVAGKCKLLYCYISAGLFKESFDTMEEIDVSNVSDEVKAYYYLVCRRLFIDMKGYSDIPLSPGYDSTLILYCDSALMYLQPDTYEYDDIAAFRYTNGGDLRGRLQLYLNVLSNYTLTLHQTAVVYSKIGNLSYALKDVDNAIYYMALSAIYDTRSAIRETTAKKELARFLASHGDVVRASKYVRIALEEANSYNARHRKIEINAVLPIVEKQRLELIQKQKTSLTILLLAVSVLFVALGVTLFALYKQMKKLRLAKHSIQTQFDEISVINGKLGSAIQMLEESNEIKDQYIVQSLWGKSEHLEKMEYLLRKQERRIKTRQYEDLQMLYKDFDVKAERENLFSDFDRTFLKLFPNFLDEYNRFFESEDRIKLNDGENLPPEFRIFALIRLGITENERIAKFLNLSVNTIYSYKRKVKNRAVIPKEEFEYRIMQIKKK